MGKDKASTAVREQTRPSAPSSHKALGSVQRRGDEKSGCESEGRRRTPKGW